jgi:predicted DNA-binding WGR domain protein
LDSLDNLSPLFLQARNPQRNVYRFYNLAVNRNLFGDWIVTCCYGRIGCAGTLKHHAYPSYEEAKAFFNHVLTKRNKAHKRIKCTYKNVGQGGDGYLSPDPA